MFMLAKISRTHADGVRNIYLFCYVPSYPLFLRHYEGRVLSDNKSLNDRWLSRVMKKTTPIHGRYENTFTSHCSSSTRWFFIDESSYNNRLTNHEPKKHQDADNAKLNLHISLFPKQTLSLTHTKLKESITESSTRKSIRDCARAKNDQQ